MKSLEEVLLMVVIENLRTNHTSYSKLYYLPKKVSGFKFAIVTFPRFDKIRFRRALEKNVPNFTVMQLKTRGLQFRKQKFGIHDIDSNEVSDCITIKVTIKNQRSGLV